MQNTTSEKEQQDPYEPTTPLHMPTTPLHVESSENSPMSPVTTYLPQSPPQIPLPQTLIQPPRFSINNPYLRTPQDFRALDPQTVTWGYRGISPQTPNFYPNLQNTFSPANVQVSSVQMPSRQVSRLPVKKVAAAKNSVPPLKQSEPPAQNLAPNVNVVDQEVGAGNDAEAQAYQLIAIRLKSLPEFDKKPRFIIRTGTLGKIFPKWQFLVLVYDETKDAYFVEKNFKFNKDFPKPEGLIEDAPLPQRITTKYKEKDSFWTIPRVHKEEKVKLSDVMGLDNFEHKDEKLWIKPIALANLLNVNNKTLLKINKNETAEKRIGIFFEDFEMFKWGPKYLPKDFSPPNLEGFLENKKKQSPLTALIKKDEQASQNLVPSLAVPAAQVPQNPAPSLVNNNTAPTTTSRVIQFTSDADFLRTDVNSSATQNSVAVTTSTSLTSALTAPQASHSETSANSTVTAQAQPSEKSAGDQSHMENEKEEHVEELQRNNPSLLKKKNQDLQKQNEELIKRLDVLAKKQEEDRENSKKEMQELNSSYLEMLKRLDLLVKKTEFTNTNKRKHPEPTILTSTLTKRHKHITSEGAMSKAPSFGNNRSSIFDSTNKRKSPEASSANLGSIFEDQGGEPRRKSSRLNSANKG